MSKNILLYISAIIMMVVGLHSATYAITIKGIVTKHIVKTVDTTCDITDPGCNNFQITVIHDIETGQGYVFHSKFSFDDSICNTTPAACPCPGFDASICEPDEGSVVEDGFACAVVLKTPKGRNTHKLCKVAPAM